MSTLVAANMARLHLEVSDQYGIARQDLLAEAGLDSSELLDPNALIPRSSADALLRALARHFRRQHRSRARASEPPAS